MTAPTRRHVIVGSIAALGAAGAPAIAAGHLDADLLAMEAELDAACLRWWNASDEDCDALAEEMLEIGHGIIDTRAHTVEGMRFKLMVRGKMQIGDSSDDDILESIARDLGIENIDAMVIDGVTYAT